MVSISDNRLVGAGVFDQALFDALLAHEHDEEEGITASEAFASGSFDSLGTSCAVLPCVRPF